MSNQISRREFMIKAGLSCAAIVSAGTLAQTLQPGLAEAAKKPKVENVNDVLKEYFGSKKINMSHVKLRAPIIAENGAVVPVSITSDLPMKTSDYVKKVYIFVDKNYHPFIASSTLSPANGKAAFSLRIKMRKTSKVRAIVETSKGELYGAIKSVKVTIGGCGG